MTAKTGTVYVLVDPRGDTIRYIGQTRRPIAQRLSGHLSSRGVPVADWISELRGLSLAPLVRAVVTDVPVVDLIKVEEEQIRKHYEAGWPLLNRGVTQRLMSGAIARRRLEKARLIGGPLVEQAVVDLELAEKRDAEDRRRCAETDAHLRWLFPEDPSQQPDAIMRHVRSEGNEHLLPAEAWEQFSAVMVDLAAALKGHGYSFQDVLYSHVFEGAYHLTRQRWRDTERLAS